MERFSSSQDDSGPPLQSIGARDSRSMKGDLENIARFCKYRCTNKIALCVASAGFLASLCFVFLFPG